MRSIDMAERKEEILFDGEILEPTALRIGIEEDFIVLEFGDSKEIDETRNIFDVSAKIRIKPKALRFIIGELYNIGLSYEKTYNRDIGFSSVDDNQK